MRVFKKTRKDKGDSRKKKFIKDIKKKRDTILVIIAFATVVIAIGSLLTAIATFRAADNQLREPRKQTEIMIRSFMETHKYSPLKPQEPKITFFNVRPWPGAKEFGIFIQNSGHSLAIMEEIILVVDGKIYNAFKDRDFYEAIKKLGLLSISLYSSRNTYLEPGETKKYLVMENGRKDESEFIKFENAPSKLTIRIKYASIDGNKFYSEFKFK